MKFFCLFTIAIASLAYIECYEKNENVVFRYKSDATLDCSELKGDVKFYKTNNGTEELLVEDDHVKIDNNFATLSDLRKDYILPNYTCKDSSNNKINFIKQIQPFLVKPEKPSLTITQGGFTDQLACKILYGQNGNWTWYKDDVEIQSSEIIKIQYLEFETILTIQVVEEENRGKYNCTYTNEYGQHSEMIELRVKDPLAALWPFLAIIAEVVILCSIILIYEKKCAKKPSHEEENEQNTNLLNHGGANSDLKKRTAKA